MKNETLEINIDEQFRLDKEKLSNDGNYEIHTISHLLDQENEESDKNT